MSEAKEKFEAACRTRIETLREEIEGKEKTIGLIELVLGEKMEEAPESPRSKKRTRGRRPKAVPKKTRKGSRGLEARLADTAAVVLGTRGPTGITDLVVLVEKKGYVFGGKNKRQLLYLQLRNDKRFVSGKRGIWELRK